MRRDQFLPQAEMVLKIGVDRRRQCEPTYPVRGQPWRWRKGAPFPENARGTVRRDEAYHERRGEQTKRKGGENPPMAQEHQFSITASPCRLPTKLSGEKSHQAETHLPTSGTPFSPGFHCRTVARSSNASAGRTRPSSAFSSPAPFVAWGNPIGECWQRKIRSPGIHQTSSGRSSSITRQSKPQYSWCIQTTLPTCSKSIGGKKSRVSESPKIRILGPGLSNVWMKSLSGSRILLPPGSVKFSVYSEILSARPRIFAMSPPLRTAGRKAELGSIRQSEWESASTIALNATSAPRNDQCVSCI